MYISNRLYLNNNVRRTNDTADVVREYAEKEGISSEEEKKIGLLIEETVGMIAGMAGDFEGELWLEGDSKSCDICLEAGLVSGNPEKETPGVMAKLGNLLRCSFLFDSREEVPAELGLALPSYMKSGLKKDETVMIGKWSLSVCREELTREARESAEARESLEELEMSIVGNLATDVVIGLQEGKLRLVITRSF